MQTIRGESQSISFLAQGAGRCVQTFPNCVPYPCGYEGDENRHSVAICLATHAGFRGIETMGFARRPRLRAPWQVPCGGVSSARRPKTFLLRHIFPNSGTRHRAEPCPRCPQRRGCHLSSKWQIRPISAAGYIYYIPRQPTAFCLSIYILYYRCRRCWLQWECLCPWLHGQNS